MHEFGGCRWCRWLSTGLGSELEWIWWATHMYNCSMSSACRESGPYQSGPWRQVQSYGQQQSDSEIKAPAQVGMLFFSCFWVGWRWCFFSSERGREKWNSWSPSLPSHFWINSARISLWFLRNRVVEYKGHPHKQTGLSMVRSIRRIEEKQNTKHPQMAIQRGISSKMV